MTQRGSTDMQQKKFGQKVAGPAHTVLQFNNFVLFWRKTAQTSNFNFFHTLCIEDRALTLNIHVIHAHAYNI
jgi:hypothetical protein